MSRLKRSTIKPKKTFTLPIGSKGGPNSSRLDYYSREMKRRDYLTKKNEPKKRSPRYAESHRSQVVRADVKNFNAQDFKPSI